MNKVEVAKLIEEDYVFAQKPFVVCVLCENDVFHYGHFYSFKDYEELKGTSHFRFIPRNNMKSFLSEYSKNGSANTNYSIILDSESIIGIEFVMPLHI